MARITTIPYNEIVRGTNGDDQISTLFHNNMPHRYIYGLWGNDLIIVRSWSFSRDHPIYWNTPISQRGERIDGGAGNDSIYGNGDQNNIFGGDGNDLLYGGSPIFDPIFGEPTVDDIIIGGAGADRIFGQAGNDRLYGGDHADMIDGGAGTDTLDGGTGHDRLFGSWGADILIGGAGNDTLTGGVDKDSLSGGAGMDHFVFDKATDTGRNAATADLITDFQRGVDKIDLLQIDARTDMAGNQMFRFLGTSKFSHRAGEICYTVDRTGLTIQGDVNGDGIADFAIRVATLQALSASDFIL